MQKLQCRRGLDLLFAMGRIGRNIKLSELQNFVTAKNIHLPFISQVYSTALSRKFMLVNTQIKTYRDLFE